MFKLFTINPEYSAILHYKTQHLTPQALSFTTQETFQNSYILTHTKNLDIPSILGKNAESSEKGFTLPSAHSAISTG